MTPLPLHDYEEAREAADFIQTTFGKKPEVAIFAGTGLGDISETAQIEAAIDYSEIPHFPSSSVETHQSRLSCTEISGRTTILMQGRFHLYEGYSARAVAFPVRVMHCLGVNTLILTNAAGGLNPLFAVGDLMIIDDHINFTGENPIAGPHDDRWGSRFPDMTQAYSGHLRDLAQSAASDIDVNVQAGVYVGLKGPSLETPAEMRFLRKAGADAVGFSTVMEAIAGVQLGMQVLGVSAITNSCVPDAPLPAVVSEIVAAAQDAAPSIGHLIKHILQNLDKDALP